MWFDDWASLGQIVVKASVGFMALVVLLPISDIDIPGEGRIRK